MEHARRALEHIGRRMSRGQQLVLFLDFDGTLAPIVRDPSKARMAKRTHTLVERLARRVPLYIVTGRSLRDIRKRARIRGARYAGNHGMEWSRGAATESVRVSSAAQKDVRDALRALRPLRRYRGVFIEDKKISVAFHYRGVSRREMPEVIQTAHRVLAPILKRGRIEALQQKKLLDVRPKGWHKGGFVRLVMRHMPKNSVAVYIGDDATDEDAFGALRASEIGIRVGKRSSSRAGYYLSSQRAMDGFLLRLAAQIDDR
ncbi:MAG TPA: trehalose-phosphatase [Candidatus Paceibacterota bacterium]|nr:trehalose-phosphatase [Candidatus Paceibacterota bacterium]